MLKLLYKVYLLYNEALLSLINESSVRIAHEAL